jgi:hypothetical protein
MVHGSRAIWNTVMSLKCPECGLSNFPSATNCKRCHAQLASGSDLENIWRDGDCLVINPQEFMLLERCLKCNTSLNLSKEVLEMSFYPFYNFLTILPGIHTVFWTKYTIPVFLCSEHHRFALSGPTNNMLPDLLIILGIIALIMGVFIQEAALLFWPLGLGCLGLGLLLLWSAKSLFKIKKRAKPLIWIKGVDPQYLALLPRHK